MARAASSAPCACACPPAISGLDKVASSDPGRTRCPSSAISRSTRASAFVPTLTSSASTMPCNCSGAGRLASHRPSAMTITTINPTTIASDRLPRAGGVVASSIGGEVVDPVAGREQSGEREIIFIGRRDPLALRRRQHRPGIDERRGRRLPFREGELLHPQIFARRREVAVEQQEGPPRRLDQIPGAHDLARDVLARLCRRSGRGAFLLARRIQRLLAVEIGQQRVAQADARDPVGFGRQRMVAVRIVAAERKGLGTVSRLRQVDARPRDAACGVSTLRARRGVDPAEKGVDRRQRRRIDEQRRQRRYALRLIEQPRQRIGRTRFLELRAQIGPLCGVAGDLDLKHAGMWDDAVLLELAGVGKMAIEPRQRLAGRARQLRCHLPPEIAADQSDAGQVAAPGLLGPRHVDGGIGASLHRRDRSTGVQGHGCGHGGSEHRVARLILKRIGNGPEDRRQRRTNPLDHLSDDLLQTDGEIARKLRQEVGGAGRRIVPRAGQIDGQRLLISDDAGGGADDRAAETARGIGDQFACAHRMVLAGQAGGRVVELGQGRIEAEPQRRLRRIRRHHGLGLRLRDHGTGEGCQQRQPCRRTPHHATALPSCEQAPHRPVVRRSLRQDWFPHAIPLHPCA
ncbi:hypothetical protein WR25_20073 [Diploscapter pachys]|uniref:Uncharacterized protein n=1 Tax=Diploscapter pachys TaxID=2018661 RepID=A0A2A2JW33_9BILA|nr:hypothetical protein WR25_20073 [Diploscapter pachys]